PSALLHRRNQPRGQATVPHARAAHRRRRLPIGLKSLEARPAMNALVNRLGRRGWEAAQQQLVATGQQAVPFLIVALGDDEQDLRQAQAAQTLGLMGPTAAGALPSLTKALRSPQTHVRRAAAEALRRIGPPAEQDAAGFVETLRGLLRDWSLETRASA